MHPLRWHLMMLLLSGLLYYSPQGLYHWDFGWIALAVNTIQTISANILHTYLQWSHASVYFTCTHPRITKPKGNSYLGILSKNNSYNKG